MDEFVYVHVNIFVYLSICLTINLSIYLSVYLSVDELQVAWMDEFVGNSLRDVYIYIYLYVYLYMYMYIYIYIYIYIYLFIYIQVAWMDEFVEELQDLATDRLFQHRLMFAQMCVTCLQDLDAQMGQGQDKVRTSTVQGPAAAHSRPRR